MDSSKVLESGRRVRTSAAASGLNDNVMKLINNMLDCQADAGGLSENVVQWSDCGPDGWCYYIVIEATNAHGHERRSKGSVIENWTPMTDDAPAQNE